MGAKTFLNQRITAKDIKKVFQEHDASWATMGINQNYANLYPEELYLNPLGIKLADDEVTIFDLLKAAYDAGVESGESNIKDEFKRLIGVH